MTTPPHDDLDDALDATADDDLTGTVLHSFAVLARFRSAADTAAEAEDAVRRLLRPVGDLLDDVRVEPREPDGRWAVDVRFVVASVDGETAVDGVHRTLRDSDVTPDEAWVAEQLP